MSRCQRDQPDQAGVVLDRVVAVRVHGGDVAAPDVHVHARGGVASRSRPRVLLLRRRRPREPLVGVELAQQLGAQQLVAGRVRVGEVVAEDAVRDLRRVHVTEGRKGGIVTPVPAAWG